MTVLAAQPSTLQTLATNLINLTLAQPVFAGVDAGWGNPVESAPDEIIAFQAAPAEITTAAIGSQRRTEQYDLDIIISIIQSDPSSYGAMQRAFLYRDAIAAVIRADATVGGAVMWALDQGWEPADRGDGNRSEYQLVMHVHCYARI